MLVLHRKATYWSTEHNMFAPAFSMHTSTHVYIMRINSGFHIFSVRMKFKSFVFCPFDHRSALNIIGIGITPLIHTLFESPSLEAFPVLDASFSYRWLWNLVFIPIWFRRLSAPVRMAFVSVVNCHIVWLFVFARTSQFYFCLSVNNKKKTKRNVIFGYFYIYWHYCSMRINAAQWNSLFW